MITTKTTRPDAFRELGLAAAGFYLHLNGEKDDDGIITTADGLFKALGGPEKERRALISSGDVLAFSDGTLVIRDHLKANKNLFGTIYYTPSASPHRAELYVMADYSYTLNPRLGRPLTSLKRQDMLSHSLAGAPQICDEPDPFPDDAPPEFVPQQPEQKREPEKITTTTEPNLTEPNLTEPKDKDARKRKQQETPSSPSLVECDSDENGVIKGTEVEDSPDFTEFWKAYPKKVGKGRCRKWWKVHKPSHALVEKMLEVLATISQSVQWTKDEGKWVPLPHTWLNEERWEDGDPVPGGSGSSSLSSAGAGAGFAAFWDGLDEYQKESAIKTAEEAGFKTVKEWYDAH